MKIRRIKIENFRKIKSLELDLLENDLVNVIVGQNELGKSTVLNAISWFFTDTLLTDKWGVGENDTKSIKNNKQQKGEHVSVSVSFVDDEGNNLPTFTKKLKTGYDRETGEANKHTTECQINNNSAISLQEWERELHKIIGLKKTFYKINELRAYTDPLYLLQKLDAKELRAFLVELGCVVANDEVYNSNPDFEVLKKYEKEYNCDMFSMETNYKKFVKDAKTELTKAEAKLEEYNSVSFDESKLEGYLKERDELTAKKVNLVNNTDTEALKLGFEIKALETEKANIINEQSLILNSKIESLKAQIEQETINADKLKSSELMGITNAFYEKQNEKASLEKEIKIYTSNIDLLRSQLVGCQDLAKQQVALKNDYQIKLTLEYDKEYELTICPNCNHSFAYDIEAYNKFNAQKQANIELFTGYIAKCNEVIENSKKSCEEYIKKANDIKNEIAKVNNLLVKVNEELTELSNKLNNYEMKPADYSKVEELKIQLDDLEINSINIDTTNIDIKINELTAKKEALEMNNKLAIDKELNAIQEQLNDLENYIALEYIERSRYNTKLEKQKEYDDAVKNLNDLDYILNLCVKFNNKYLTLLNARALEKTGINFVLLEKNLTNNKYSQVCYAVDSEGVPFKDINTSRKITFGIDLIHKIKEIACADFGATKNYLPILADRLEGYDFIEKIKNIATDTQIICTRVTTDSSIKVI